MKTPAEYSDVDSCFYESSITTQNEDSVKKHKDPFIKKTAKWRLVKNNPLFNTPSKKNHSTSIYKDKLYVFGGYDGKKNHNSITMFDIAA